MPGIGEDSNVRASGGNVDLTVRPDAGGFEPASHADVTLQELTFRVIFGTEEETWRLDELTMENVLGRLVRRVGGSGRQNLGVCSKPTRRPN